MSAPRTPSRTTRPRRRSPAPGPWRCSSCSSSPSCCCSRTDGRSASPTPRASPAGSCGGALALAGRVFELDADRPGDRRQAARGALRRGGRDGAVRRRGCRHGRGEGRWAGFALVLGTTLAAAAQAFSGEAPAACAVAIALWLLARADAVDDGRLVAPAGLPLALAVALQPSTLPLALGARRSARWCAARRALVPFLLWAAPGAALAASACCRRPDLAAATPRRAGARAPLLPRQGRLRLRTGGARRPRRARCARCVVRRAPLLGRARAEPRPAARLRPRLRRPPGARSSRSAAGPTVSSGDRASSRPPGPCCCCSCRKGWPR